MHNIARRKAIVLSHQFPILSKASEKKNIWWKSHWAAIISLLIAGAFFLGSSVQGELLNYDDERYIDQNELIRKLDTESVSRMFGEYFDGHYHPVTLLSLALDRAIFKDYIKGHHLVNLFLHLLNAVLVYLFLLALFRQQWLAFGVALLFLLHPMNVESYAWMTERKNVLYSSFFLGAALSYLRYLQKPGWPFLLLTFLLYTLSILSKAQAMAFVPVMFLLDYLYRRNIRSMQLYLEKLPFILLAVGFVILTTGAQSEEWGELNTTGYDQVEKLALASYGFLSYLFRGLIPLGQSAYYPYPSDYGAELGWYVYASIGGALAFLYLLWLTYSKGKTTLFFGLAFFLINIFLMLKYLDVPYGNYYMANRYNYLPLIGLLVIPLELLGKWSKKQKFSVYIPVAVIAVAYGWQANNRIEVWNNSVDLWTDVIDHYPGYSHALNMRALGNIAEGRTTDAVRDYTELIALDPDFRESYVNLAVLYYRMDDPKRALEWAGKALTRFPDDDRLYNLTATIRLKLNQRAQALADIDKAISLTEEANPEYHLTKARILIQSNQRAEAEKELLEAQSLPKARQLLTALRSQQAVTQDQSSNTKLLQQATSLAKQGRTEEAIPIFDQIIAADPNNRTAYLNRGSAHGQSGSFDLALKDFQTALALESNDGRVHYLLGVTYRDMGQQQRACEHFTQAASLGWQLDAATLNYCRN
jgi:tetratricopeptide (TPR) repeat protein